MAIEFKCPYPGKTFTTTVHYAIPDRYITQLLCEMAVLNCCKLLFISWTASSSTVFEVIFDDQLWSDLLTECIDVYGPDIPKRPTRRSEGAKELKEKIKQFSANNVKFIAEVQSMTADECEHSTCDSNDLFHHHVDAKEDRTEIAEHKNLESLHHMCLQAIQLVSESDERLKEKASEILVWIITDKTQK